MGGPQRRRWSRRSRAPAWCTSPGAVATGGRPPRLLRTRPYVAFCRTYTLLFVFAFSSFANFGILTRQRVQVFPFVLVLLALPLASSGRRRSACPRPASTPARTYCVTTTDQLPALLGGPQAFPEGLPLVRPTIPDIPALTARIEAILESGMLTNGPTVRELEERAAELLDVPHVVALSSCTAGLMLVLQALDARGPVVMPSFTFAASAHAVHWAGGTPVCAEVRRIPHPRSRRRRRVGRGRPAPSP